MIYKIVAISINIKNERCKPYLNYQNDQLNDLCIRVLYYK